MPVTPTPRGPLIDGSERREPIVLKGKFEDAARTLGAKFLDLPMGECAAEAKVVTPDGDEQPLKVTTEFQAEGPDSVEVGFRQAGVYDSIQEIKLYVSR